MSLNKLLPRGWETRWGREALLALLCCLTAHTSPCGVPLPFLAPNGDCCCCCQAAIPLWLKTRSSFWDWCWCVPFPAIDEVVPAPGTPTHRLIPAHGWEDVAESFYGIDACFALIFSHPCSRTAGFNPASLTHAAWGWQGILLQAEHKDGTDETRIPCVLLVWFGFLSKKERCGVPTPHICAAHSSHCLLSMTGFSYAFLTGTSESPLPATRGCFCLIYLT